MRILKNSEGWRQLLYVCASLSPSLNSQARNDVTTCISRWEQRLDLLDLGVGEQSEPCVGALVLAPQPLLPIPKENPLAGSLTSFKSFLNVLLLKKSTHCLTQRPSPPGMLWPLLFSSTVSEQLCRLPMRKPSHPARLGFINVKFVCHLYRQNVADSRNS